MEDREVVELAYHIDGDGPWLTLLHGFSQDRRLWSAQLEPFSARYTVLSVDLRGHGRSPVPDSGYGPVEYAADVLALLDRLGIAATHIWGSHTGAAIGLLIASGQPDRVGALVLEGAVIPGVPVPSVEEYQARAREIAMQRGVAAARDDWFDHIPVFDGIRRDPVRRRAVEHREMIDDFSGAPWLATLPALPVPDVAGRLGAIRNPALIVNGSDDHNDFHAVAVMLERGLRAPHRFVVPGSGGFPAWEEPDVVNPLVMSFLDDVD